MVKRALLGDGLALGQAGHVDRVLFFVRAVPGEVDQRLACALVHDTEHVVLVTDRTVDRFIITTCKLVAGEGDALVADGDVTSLEDRESRPRAERACRLRRPY